MPFQLSPGVTFTETDLTLIVPAVATTSAGFIGVFQWGPAEEVVTITSENNLLERFGKPAFDATYARYWFVASNFLKYGNNLKLVRYRSSGDMTATVEGGGLSSIYNRATYDANVDSTTGKGEFAAKYAGDLGNSLKIYILDYTAASVSSMTDTTASDNYYDLIDNFEDVPGTSPWAETLTGNANVKDEIHILVVDAGGRFSGVAGSVLEKFGFLSKARNARNADGESNYYKDVINNKSKYIWWLKHPTAVTTTAGDFSWGDELLPTNTTGSFDLINSISQDGLWTDDRIIGYLLTGGVTDTTPAEDDAISSAYYTYFESGQEVDVSLLIAGPMAAVNAKRVIEVAESRKDCVAFVSPQPSTLTTISTLGLTDVLAYREALNISSSYGVMDSGWKLQYDYYNDRYIYVPLCADFAGACVKTDFEYDPWFSPAGFTRGQIKNSVRLVYNPGKADRDELYKKNVNPIVSFGGEGTVIFGDKTLLTRPSAFDRINVRRLFIVLEKAIATAAKYLLFEFNDEFTRAQFRQLVEPYLREVQGRRGITDFRVVCDETNNTPQVIDSNNFVGDIYIKPNRSINFIQLNFIATPSGVNFEEVGAPPAV